MQRSPELTRAVNALPVRGRQVLSAGVRRLRDVSGRQAPLGRRSVPPRPVGVKLEMTHACNFRCAFCYTDSPRQTLERAVDLSDDDWRRVVGEALDLGVIEAVVTGGEPLLRRELTLEILERLDAHGVGVSFNTNGWFVDDAVADRLGSLRGLTVHLSLDGATPVTNDRSRGVPGGWRRATEAISRLLERGVRVNVVKIVTPENEHEVTEYLDTLWLLGVRFTRLATVSRVGAAARAGSWDVNVRRVRRAIARARRRYGDQLTIRFVEPAGVTYPLRGDNAPASMLVRPAGAVRTESISPFTFGNVRAQSLEQSWARIAEHWRDPSIVEWWNAGAGRGRARDAGAVPYLDGEVPVGQTALGPEAMDRAADPPIPKPARSTDPADIEAAQSHVIALSLARGYRLEPVRSSGGGDLRYVRVLGTGTTLFLNRTGALVMDACDGGRPADAVDTLARDHPGVERERIARDVLASVRRLEQHRVIRPGLARSGASTPEAVAAPDLPGEPLAIS